MKKNEVKLTDSEKQYILDLRNDAIKNYNEYLSRSKSSEDEEEVKNQISKLEKSISLETDKVKE